MRWSKRDPAAGSGGGSRSATCCWCVQIAICAVLVTSSLVAVRGLERSLHSNFGFEPRNVMLVERNLAQAGYSGDQVPAMQKRMIEAMETIPGVKRVGLVDGYPPLIYAAGSGTHVFKDDDQRSEARECRCSSRTRYEVSPGIF